MKQFAAVLLIVLLVACIPPLSYRAVKAERQRDRAYQTNSEMRSLLVRVSKNCGYVLSGDERWEKHNHAIGDVIEWADQFEDDGLHSVLVEKR